MTILVLGAAGFIGSNLMSRLSLKGYHLVGVDIVDSIGEGYRYFRFSGDQEAWQQILSTANPHCCINAAGSSDVGGSLSNPENDFSKNVRETSLFLEGIRKGPGNRCKYIHISSAAVYGNPSLLPVNETAPAAPISPYGWNKLMSEELCREYHSLYGLPVAIARPFSVFGRGLKKQLFWDIYQKWKSDNDRIELWGTGDETRDFIHIDDLVDSLELLFLKSGMNADIYNVANAEMVTVRTAAQKLIDLLGGDKRIEFNGMNHEGNPKFWRADIEKIRKLGYEPTRSFEAGLADLSEWMKSL
jgi:nucleoside-diphosphate-sugar epimerase